MLAGVDHGRYSEPAAGGLSRERDVPRGRAAAQECFVRRESIVDRRGIWVLGGEPIIDGDDLGAGAPADLRGQVGGEEGVPQHVDPAVEVHDDVAGLDPVDRDLGRSDVAEGGFGHGHIGGQRLRRQELAEHAPLFIDAGVRGEGSLSQDRLQALSLFDAHGRSALPAAASTALMGAPAGRSRG